MSHQELSSQDLPRHIAFIMDGNGRWAKAKGKARIQGHRAGAKAVREVISCAARLGVSAVTLFAFSSENWQRPKDEVNLLMDLFFSALTKESKKLHENNLKLQIIGNRLELSDKLQLKIKEVEALTQHNTGTIINIAVNYGGKWDLTQAMQSMAKDVSLGLINPIEINEGLVSKYICLADLPDVDLVIRTSGEQRISNFLLWQIAYAELYFTDILWPDFDQEAMLEAIGWFIQRERRFGCTSKQLKSLMQR